MAEIENYTPEVIKSDSCFYGLVLVELEKCPLCHKYMIDIIGVKYGLFPKWRRITIEKQIERAGWAQRSSVKVDDKNICNECVKAGKADFLCALCKQRKPTNKIKDSFGDPAEFLCTDCYETVPAKVWDEKTSKLREKHRYDYE